MTKIKIGKTQINNIMNKKKRGYHYRAYNHQKDNKGTLYKLLCTHKCDNLEEMNQFLKNHKLLKLNQVKIDNVNSSVMIKNLIFNIKSPEKETSRLILFHL